MSKHWLFSSANGVNLKFLIISQKKTPAKNTFGRISKFPFIFRWFIHRNPWEGGKLFIVVVVVVVVVVRCRSSFVVGRGRCRGRRLSWVVVVVVVVVGWKKQKSYHFCNGKSEMPLKRNGDRCACGVSWGMYIPLRWCMCPSIDGCRWNQRQQHLLTGPAVILRVLEWIWPHRPFSDPD